MEKNTIKVRDVAESDYAAVCDLLGELGYPTTLKQLSLRVAKLKGQADFLKIALVNGEVAGLISAHRIPLIHDEDYVASFTSLVVKESFRGQGIGRLLCDCLEAWARKNHCHRIHVTSGLQRDQAHHFYEKLNYTCNGKRFVKSLV